jgi:hypothetical protein
LPRIFSVFFAKCGFFFKNFPSAEKKSSDKKKYHKIPMPRDKFLKSSGGTPYLQRASSIYGRSSGILFVNRATNMALLRRSLPFCNKTRQWKKTRGNQKKSRAMEKNLRQWGKYVRQ